MFNEKGNYLKIKEKTNDLIIKNYKNKASLDGILSPDIYFTPGRERIGVVVKETYAKREEVAWSPVVEPNNQYFIPYRTNKPLTVIRNSFSNLLRDDTGRVSGFGYYNISKKAKELVRNDTSSCHTSLLKSYRSDKEIFWSLIHASYLHFIIFAGTFEYVWNDLLEQFGGYFYPLYFTEDIELNTYKEKELSAWKMEQEESPILIQTYHPSYWQNVFSEIIRVINEVNKGAYFLKKYEI